MDNKEKEIAKELRDFYTEDRRYTQSRCNAMSDEFNRSLFQISSIIFGFAIAFSKGFTGQPLIVKILFLLGVLLIFLSFIFGMINNVIRERFWANLTKRQVKNARYYQNALREKISFKEAEAAVDALKNETETFESHRWAWITQMVLTFAGVLFIGLSILYIIFINSK